MTADSNSGKNYIFLAVYTVVQFFFALDGTGLEGRGTVLLFSPFRHFGIGWLALFVAVWWRSAFRGSRNTLILGVAFLMLVHYLITFTSAAAELSLYFAQPDDEVGLGRVLRLRPHTIYAGAATYVLGQFAIWAILLRKRLGRRESRCDPA